VLVFDSDRDDGLAVAARLRADTQDLLIVVVDTRAYGRDGSAAEIDVALINLVDERFDGLAFGAQLGVLCPWIEIVYWFDEQRGLSPAIAAQSVGIRRVVPLVDLVGWLERGLESLTRMARARRGYLLAEQALPPLPRPHSEHDVTTPLPEAERLFREAYLRQLLSRTGSRTIAARRAGVPYTTFCSMLKKMNILRRDEEFP
jgi:hypothetical protein